MQSAMLNCLPSQRNGWRVKRSVQLMGACFRLAEWAVDKEKSKAVARKTRHLIAVVKVGGEDLPDMGAAVGRRRRSRSCR